MRTRLLPLLTVLLLGLGAFATAEDGPDGTPEPSPTGDCEEGDDGCDGGDGGRSGNGTRDGSDDEDADGTDDPRPSNATPRPTRSPTRPSSTIQSECDDGDDCRPRSGTYVSFDGALRDGTLRNYSVSGILLLESAAYLGPLDEAEVERHGAAWEATFESDDSSGEGSGEDRLRVHDIPTGLLSFQGGGSGAFRVDLPDGAIVVRHGEETRITLGDRVARLVAPNATWDGDTVTTDGFLSIHLAPPDRSGRPENRTEEREDRIQDAIERRHVAAEVAVRLRNGEGGPVHVSTYDDVQVEVADPAGPATPDAPVRIVVSADLPEGRTLVLDVDESLLVGDALELHYFDVNADGTETEVVFRQAAGLPDVLDPTDDAGQPEYWVVEDADGVQVLVSVPHWSVHAITLASLSEAAPSILVGAVAGVAGAAVAAVVLLWPRRRHEEF